MGAFLQLNSQPAASSTAPAPLSATAPSELSAAAVLAHSASLPEVAQLPLKRECSRSNSGDVTYLFQADVEAKSRSETPEQGQYAAEGPESLARCQFSGELEQCLKAMRGDHETELMRLQALEAIVRASGDGTLEHLQAELHGRKFSEDASRVVQIMQTEKTNEATRLQSLGAIINCH